MTRATIMCVYSSVGQLGRGVFDSVLLQQCCKKKKKNTGAFWRNKNCDETTNSGRTLYPKIIQSEIKHFNCVAGAAKLASKLTPCKATVIGTDLLRSEIADTTYRQQRFLLMWPSAVKRHMYPVRGYKNSKHNFSKVIFVQHAHSGLGLAQHSSI